MAESGISEAKDMPVILVVMGVAGSGKSSVGNALAQRLGCAFQEGDDLHIPVNIDKMRSGIALSDEDRAPWLAEIERWIAARRKNNQWGVISCSALRRSYRDQLRLAGQGRTRFLFLDPEIAVLRARLDSRTDHFMQARMLESQLATLERPQDKHSVLSLKFNANIDQLCDAAIEWIKTQKPQSPGKEIWR